MESSFSLSGKVAFVTGSTRGIGWAVARVLARHGASVVLNGHTNAELVEQRAAEIRTEFSVPCLGLCSDVADPESVRACYREIFKNFKRLHVLVNNAGILQDALLGMIPDALIRRTMEVNTIGPV